MNNKPNNKPKNYRIGYQSGVGLIDVMIAVVVFSFGLLAIASLQTITKQSNFEAIQRTNASILAQDLLERMRLNNLADGTYKSALGHYVSSSNSPTVLNYDTEVSYTTNCNTGTCGTASELAAWDLYEFQQMLLGSSEQTGGTAVGGLLNPTACISSGVDSGGPGPYTITIVWKGQAALPLSTAPANTCGAGLYDSSAGDYAYRRILEITSFLGCPEPGGCA